MWCPEKLKLNVMKQVSLPSARDIFKRQMLSGVGTQLPPESAYGDGEEVCPMPSDKLAQIHAAENEILDSMHNE